MAEHILIIDDEADIRSLIQGILGDEGFSTGIAANDQQAFASIAAKVPDLVILDIWLQNSARDGMEILDGIRSEHPDVPVLMISGHGNIETAVSAIKKGAYDFIEKPFKSDRMLLMIRRAIEAASLRRENKALRQRIDGPSDMVGDSPAMLAVRQILSRVAPTNSRVLITGEPGAGKDIAARALHKLSGRASEPFMALNCAILHPDRLEVELFGCEQGVDGPHARTGVLEQAHGGTLLLDEVADVPLRTQAKILRVLQEQCLQRVGGQELIQVDVRILASTNRNLVQAMEQGNFRQDLYYRLNVVPVNIPPLRERPQDIPELARHFMDAYSRDSGQPVREFSPGALAAMQSYDWPGNVRQLKNMIEWVMITASQHSAEPVRTDQLPPEIGATVPNLSVITAGEDLMAMPLREAREKFEREYLISQVHRFGGNISKTAQFVGMERSALHRKLKSLQVATGEKIGLEDEEPDQRRQAV